MSDRLLRHTNCRVKGFPKETDMVTNSNKNPGDEVAPGTDQTGKLPCERCGGTGTLGNEACPECGGTGEIIVNVGDA